MRELGGLLFISFWGAQEPGYCAEYKVKTFFIVVTVTILQKIFSTGGKPPVPRYKIKSKIKIKN